MITQEHWLSPALQTFLQNSEATAWRILTFVQDLSRLLWNWTAKEWRKILKSLNQELLHFYEPQVSLWWQANTTCCSFTVTRKGIVRDTCTSTTETQEQRWRLWKDCCGLEESGCRALLSVIKCTRNYLVKRKIETLTSISFMPRFSCVQDKVKRDN